MLPEFIVIVAEVNIGQISIACVLLCIGTLRPGSLADEELSAGWESKGVDMYIDAIACILQGTSTCDIRHRAAGMSRTVLRQRRILERYHILL